VTDELEGIERKRSWPNPGIITEFASRERGNGGIRHVSREVSYHFTLPC
jgi:hypothetical protein